MGNSKFVISIDFELKWGVFDVLGDRYNKNIIGARSAVPKILDMFQMYDVNATWAVVGFLFCRDDRERFKYDPFLKPSYVNSKLDSYGCVVGENEDVDDLHFGHSLVKMVHECPGQELASHSYSHYYCLADGQNINEFEDDVRAAVYVAKDKFGVDLKSFVFPRNEVNLEYLDVLKKYSFRIYRDVYPTKYKNDVLERVFRFLNSFVPISRHVVNHSVDRRGLKSTKGDRFLRPYLFPVFNYLMLKRIRQEMLFAAKNNSVFHLWWHPHNFGVNQEKNFRNLENILKYYKTLNKKYNMKSVCMKDL